jgi:hypothetical protein
VDWYQLDCIDPAALGFSCHRIRDGAIRMSRGARRIFDKPKETVLNSVAIAGAASNMYERQR